jgi:hypothetical protein
MGIGDSLRMTVDMHQYDSSLTDNGKQYFMILCPAAAENSGVIEALYALYYLPQHYKLLITAVGAKSKAVIERVREIMRSESLGNRVTLKDEAAGLSETAPPFLDANVVVYGSKDPIYKKEGPHALVVFDITSKLTSLDGNYNFAVATSSPEALASAILHVARNQQ